MKLLTQNSKLKKTSKITGKKTLDFALPAIKTCPFADACKKYCYASKGTYLWSNVKAKHEANYLASVQANFTRIMFEEIVMSQAQAIRLQSSGDFYSIPYVNKWITLMNALPHVTFYAYTKSIPFFKDLILPSNFTLVYSYGGKADYLIDKKKHKHTVVISKTEVVPKQYSVMGNNDHLVLAKNKNIALIKH